MLHLQHRHEHTPKKFKYFINHVIYVVGLIGPIMTIPQISNIWIDKNTSGVSLISWSTYAFVAIFWLLYGIANKDKPLIITSSIWIVLDLLIVIGILIN